MPEPLISHVNIIDQSENLVLLKYLENDATVFESAGVGTVKCFVHELGAQKLTMILYS